MVNTMTDSVVHQFQDSSTAHSLQNPPLLSPLSKKFFSSLSPQDAASQLYSNSEILAPMVRASTTPLRALALRHGASLVYTEEMIDRSITPTDRILNKELGTIDYVQPKHTYSAKVQRRMAADVTNPDGKNGAILLRIDPSIERGKIVYQLGTGEPNLALEAATKIERDVDGIDINMGCPKKFSVSGGMGSALLSDARRACDIIRTLRRNLSIPVSAKIRMLDAADARKTVDFIQSLIQAGANAIAIHGRIVGDESHIMARWDTLVEVVKRVKQVESVPVIVNGDLYTRADIREMKRRTGCDGVMLGRPALYNASIFRKDQEESPILDENNDEKEIPLSQFQERRHTGYYGYTSPLLHSRTSVIQEYVSQCVKYRAHPKNAKYVVCEMMNIRRAPTKRVPYLPMEYPGGQTIDKVCKCRSLDQLCKVWDVGLTDWKTDANDLLGDNRNYDDRYFLDHERFRMERKKAVDTAISAKSGSEKILLSGKVKLNLSSMLMERTDDKKKVGDGCDPSCGNDSSPVLKRPKL